MRKVLFAFFFALALLLAAARARASSVTELVREASAHAEAHEDDLAIRRYTEALSIDPTCEVAYLGLGEIRARLGDWREAERVYSVALSHSPTLTRALAGRARARRAIGDRAGSEEDLDAFATSEEDANALRELAGWYADDGRAPAQLAAWRRLYALAMRKGDEGREREARRMVRALQMILDAADPVVAPGADSVRRGMARMARRGV